MFPTPVAILTKHGRYLCALQAKTAIVHHLVMSGSCIALSRSCGISLVVLKTSSGMSLAPTVFFQIALTALLHLPFAMQLWNGSRKITKLCSGIKDPNCSPVEKCTKASIGVPIKFGPLHRFALNSYHKGPFAARILFIRSGPKCRTRMPSAEERAGTWDRREHSMYMGS